MTNEQHGADDVEPASNSTDEQNTQDSTDSAPTATSGIIETAGAHAPVLDEATPDITDEAQSDPRPQQDKNRVRVHHVA